MEKIAVHFMYPEGSGYGETEKELELNQLELIALLNSDLFGSEGSYYKIECKGFEDTKKGLFFYIILKK